MILKTERIEKLINALPESIDAVILFERANKRYFTGVDTSDAGTLIVTREKAFFIIDSRYIEISKHYETEKLQIILQQELFTQIKDICFQEKIKKIAIETQTVSVATLEKLKQVFSDITIDVKIDVSKIIMELRSVKDTEEISKIKAAQKITDQAFKYILTKIEVGKSEKELALELEFFMRSHGADNTSFDIIFVGGQNTSLPHGVPTNYCLKKGDFITIDFGADVDGYKSDMTRTIALGSVSDEQKKVYEIVLSAQQKALAEIMEGKVCQDIDRIAREHIIPAGYGDFFGHALGHSVGLDIHESPVFSPRCQTVLKEGMVLTVEPGIYLPQKFGVRIEDMVIVTKNGAENLTKTKKSLIII